MLERLGFSMIDAYQAALRRSGHEPDTSEMGRMALAEDGWSGLCEMYIGAAYMRAAIVTETAKAADPPLIPRIDWFIGGIVKSIETLVRGRAAEERVPWSDLEPGVLQPLTPPLQPQTV